MTVNEQLQFEVDQPHLAKILRLTATPVKSYTRTTARGAQQVRQSVQNRQPGVLNQGPTPSGPNAGGKLGQPYTTSWSNVSTGDVIEFAPGDLWEVIPANQYPGYNPSTSSGTSTGSGSGTTGSGSATSATTVGAGTSGATTTTGTGTSSSSSTGTANTSTSSNYLQNWYNKQRYAIITLPNNTAVTVLPVIP